MNTITITLSDERLLKLKEMANEAGVAPEGLLRANVEDWLARPKPEFLQAAAYVLNKNAELYRRLAG